MNQTRVPDMEGYLLFPSFIATWILVSDSVRLDLIICCIGLQCDDMTLLNSNLITSVRPRLSPDVESKLICESTSMLEFTAWTSI